MPLLPELLKRRDDYATGQSDQTVVVFTSDHGDQMGYHGMLGKSVMYEGAVQVPWMLRAPGLRAHRNHRPVSHIDFLPTVLDL
ncbi:MAG: sulfatase-like hydrolase/transferase [Opitutaceae bacterium]|nr:sulfatase-like hydrolase/transferase [Opitutaceae bacterium]